MEEGTLNLAGYELLELGRIEQSLRVFALNAEVYPRSANVDDSLSDAYLASCNTSKELELAEKALTLLPGDTTSTAQRKSLIERAIKEKIERLRPKSGSGPS